jgi:hypothetical protein
VVVIIVAASIDGTIAVDVEGDCPNSAIEVNAANPLVKYTPCGI